MDSQPQESPACDERSVATLPVAARLHKVTTDSKHPFSRYPNLLKEAIVDLPTGRGWQTSPTSGCPPLLLAGLGHSRRLLLSILSRLASLAMDRRAPYGGCSGDGARLPEARCRSHPPFRSRGAQYACGEYVARLEQIGAQISMVSAGNPYEKTESFFRTLKMEEVYLKDYRTFEEAEANIGEFNRGGLQQEAIALEFGLLGAGRIRSKVRP